MGQILVVGLGPGGRDQLTLAAHNAIQNAQTRIFRTQRHPCAQYALENGWGFATLDDLYSQAQDYDAFAKSAAERVLELSEGEDVLYAVPDVRDNTVRLLLSLAPQRIKLMPGVPIDGQLSAYAEAECLTMPAAGAQFYARDNQVPLIVRELDNPLQVSELKLVLLEEYDPEHTVYITGERGMLSMPLGDIDRLDNYDHTMCLFVPPSGGVEFGARHAFYDLVRVVERLTAPGGCPWDQKQTHQSMKGQLIEEAYEVLDAIDQGDPEALCDELGDVLLHVAMHADIAKRHGEFSVGEVTSGIVNKLVRRHPHVFGSVRADSAEEVLSNWEKIKEKERGQSSRGQAMREVTRALPALMRAGKVVKLSATQNVGYESARQAIQGAQRARARIENGKTPETMEAAYGALLFELIWLARMIKVNPEHALNRAVSGFVARFSDLEENLGAGEETPRLDDRAFSELICGPESDFT